MSYNYWRYPTIFPKNTETKLKGLPEAIARSETLEKKYKDAFYYGAMVEAINHAYFNSLYSLAIKKVIFNNPATIILWADGSKTVVMCGERDTYDPEKGMAMAIARKALGNKDLLGNSAEAEMVGDHKGIHPVVLWQVRIGFLELPNLLWIQNMDFSLKAAKAAILSEGIDKAVSVDGGSFQTDHHIAELHGAKRRHDSP